LIGVVVVDASVAVKWLLQEDYSDQVMNLTQSWLRQGTRVVAPYLMVAEVSNALFQKARRGQISIDGAINLIESLLSEPVVLEESSDIHSRALELAYSLGQPATYDSHYLALAESLDCTYWTADQRFYNAASGNYPRVRWIGES